MQEAGVGADSFHSYAYCIVYEEKKEEEEEEEEEEE